MRYIKILSLLTLLTTAQVFAADDIETLKAEIKQLKSANEKKEVEALKQEIIDLKIKRLEDKLDYSEKRLDDKINVKSERLDDKVESKFDMASFLGGNSKSELNSAKSESTPVAPLKQRNWSLSIASTASELDSLGLFSAYDKSSDRLMMGGISASLAYTKNRFFAELIGTSLSGEFSGYDYSGYGGYYDYNGFYTTYNYSYRTIKTSMKTVDFRLGYQLGGDVFKFEPYVGIGKGSLTIDSESSSFTQFAPGAKLSLGSKQARVFLDVTVPKDISSNQYNPVKLNPVTRLGLSFAF